MFSLCAISTTGYTINGYSIRSIPHARRHTDTCMISESEAKAAWLAKLDAPAWGAAAQALRTIADEASRVQALADKEEIAKQKWLASLDAPAWGQAAEAMEAMFVVEQVTEPVPVASVSEEEAKQMWLAKLDNVPTWLKQNSEEEAKKQWLAKLDTPVWGQAAATITSVVAEANKIAELTTDCDAGDSTACDALSKEEEAKIAWLAKLDVPSWGKPTSEEAAKAKWLASLDVAWGKVTPTNQKAMLFQSA